jgi:recombination protein RecT
VASTATALTVVDRVEKSPAMALLDQRSQGLLDLLPDPQAVARFRRVTTQALVKNPELLECTAESIVLSVFEAAAQGLEPTGAAGGAHLVPYNVNVGTKASPRYEKRAQLIPDYRGVIRLVTKPPSDVLSLEARVVKEGDEFTYELGTDAFVHHVPSLAAERSAKPTTHVYAVARMKNGERLPDVMDRAEIEQIQKRGRGAAFSPWATDWDEMAKKTLIKRISKVLPVRPDIRSLLLREDELAESEPAGDTPPKPTGATKVARLAARLAPAAAADDSWLGEGRDTSEDELDAAADAFIAQLDKPDVDLATTIRAAAAGSDLEGPPSDEQRTALVKVFSGTPASVTLAGIRALWADAVADGRAQLTAAQAAAILLVAKDDLEAFKAGWQQLAAVEP